MMIYSDTDVEYSVCRYISRLLAGSRSFSPQAMANHEAAAQLFDSQLRGLGPADGPLEKPDADQSGRLQEFKEWAEGREEAARKHQRLVSLSDLTNLDWTSLPASVTSPYMRCLPIHVGTTRRQSFNGASEVGYHSRKPKGARVGGVGYLVGYHKSIRYTSGVIQSTLDMM